MKNQLLPPAFVIAVPVLFPHPAFGGEPLDPTMPAAYFATIARACSLPLIVFRTPATLGATFGVEIMKRLCDVRNVVAIKDSAADPDFYRGDGACFLEPDSPLKILIDSDLTMLDFLRKGAHGATSICACLNPGAYVQMFDQRMSEKATRLQDALLPLARAVYSLPFRDFRARLKQVLVADGAFSTARVRAPLLPLSEVQQAAVLRAQVETRGFLHAGSRVLKAGDRATPER